MNTIKQSHTKTPHTPTPWYQGTKENETEEFIITENGRLISKCVERGNLNSKNQHIANARHIVKCVNMHDNLVEALKDLIMCVKKENYNISDQLAFSLDKAEQALKESEA